MKWLKGNRTSLVAVGIVAAIVVGSGRAKADFTFGEPVNLGPPFSTSYGEGVDCVSYDGLEMYFDCLNWPGGYGDWDIWVSTRITVNSEWGAPVNLGPPVNTDQVDDCAYITTDGLELYFESVRPGGYGKSDIWITRRATKDDPWGQPTNLGPVVNSSGADSLGSISSDGLELYLASHNRSGGYGSWDIWVSKRATTNDPWGEPINLGPVVNSSASEIFPCISPDGRALFFSETVNQPLRPGGFGGVDMWVTTRVSINDPWGIPLNLGPAVNTSSLDGFPRISPDGSTLYFNSERPGGYGGTWGDPYQAPIIAIVDFNGDGIVDAGDVCIMVDHWGEDYSLCDIGPMDWGDGVVDVKDLVVLAEHLFEKVDDPTLIAHWPLDEAQGVIAYDSAAVRDGTLMGGPVWQPDGGMVGGALQLDGVDDCVIAPFILNPADGPFSVFAWVKGGIPGQVIVSQIGGVDWLCLHPSEGRLTTGLGPPPGRVTPQPLVSELVITDGNWHRIGFVWDGSHRSLLVDGIVVAEVKQSGLGASGGGLYVGAGKNFAPGGFFSGLIDDVRIYNRVVHP